MPSSVLLYGRNNATGKFVPVEAVEDPPASGRFVLKSSTSATISAGDVRIGAVEIEDKTNGTRACVFSSKHLGVVTENRDTIKTAQKTVAASATAEQFAAQAVPNGFKIVVKANKGNTGQAFIGGSKADAENTAVRYPLEPDESVSLGVKNFDDIWLAVTTNGDGFSAVVET